MQINPLLMVLLYYPLSVNSNVLEQKIFAYHNDTEFKAEFAYEVVTTIYGSFRQWFFTIIFCDFTYFENRILKYTETFDNGYPVMLLDGCPASNKTEVKPRLNKHGETAYIITSEQLSLEINEYALEALKRTGVFKPRCAVIFVISAPVAVDSYFFFDMRHHFQLLWSRSITNSVLVLWSDKLRMYSFNPFLNEIEEITEVKDVTRLLRNQYHNLYGYELRLSVFRKIFVSDETGPLKCNSHLENTVMKVLNATCKPLPPKDRLTVGDLLENGTTTGVTADLIDGYTDLELQSRILKNSYYGYIDTTYPLIQEELCFLVKKTEKQSSLQTVLKLITTTILTILFFNTIILLIITVVVRKAEITLWRINTGQSASAAVVDTIKCFIRQTVDIKFTGPIFRFVTLTIMIYSLVIDCVMDGILTSAITYPRFKPEIDHIADLAQSKLILGVHDRHLMLFNKSLSSENYQLLKNSIEIVNDQKIKQIIERREFQYAVLMRKSEALYISRKASNIEAGIPLFHTMAECPVPCSVVYGLHYGSPYLPRINYILHHLNQGGILQYWIKSEDHSLFQRNKKMLYDGDNKEQKPLKFENFEEVFIVLSVCYLITTTIFLLEIGSFYIRKKSSAV